MVTSIHFYVRILPRWFTPSLHLGWAIVIPSLLVYQQLKSVVYRGSKPAALVTSEQIIEGICFITVAALTLVTCFCLNRLQGCNTGLSSLWRLITTIPFLISWHPAASCSPRAGNEKLLKVNRKNLKAYGHRSLIRSPLSGTLFHLQSASQLLLLPLKQTSKPTSL